MLNWLRNIFIAVATVWRALWAGLRYSFLTYDPKRRTFTEHYEFPELPAVVAPRFRGYHRFDLTTCIACEACAKACPANCIEIGKHKAPAKKGFQLSEFG